MEENIYIQLLGEGTIVYRLVSAIKLYRNTYRIQGKEDYDLEDEEWEFLPEEVVRVEKKELEGKIVFVAVESISEKL